MAELARKLQVLALVLTIGGPAVCVAQPGEVVTTRTAMADTVDTSTDHLSDDEWRQQPREVRRARQRAQMIARYEPTGKPEVEKLSTYVDKFRQFNIYDPRIYHFRVQASHEAGTTGSVRLSGEVNVPVYKRGIETALRDLGFNVIENNIAVLPAAELADTPFAVATAAAATMRKEPRGRAEQVNSVAMGGVIRLLREARADDITTGGAGRRGSGRGVAAVEDASPSDWYLAQSTEGYLGFMRKNELQPTKKLHIPTGILTRPTTVTLEGQETYVPAGALLHETSTKGQFALKPDGPAVPLDKDDVTRVGRPLYSREDILELMKPFMDTRYVWGGVTCTGIDCSGFTQFLWKTRGINLPRDAEEQAVVGQIVAWGGKQVFDEAQPGDIIFFHSDSGRISHVGVSLGNGDMIHSAGRGVHISRLQDTKEDTDDSHLQRVMFARRMQGR